MQKTRRTRTTSNSTGLVGGMRGVGRVRGMRGVLTDIFRLVIFGFLGAIFFLVRYVLRTPQPLRSVLPGEERLFRWTHGHIFYKVLGARDTPPLVLIHAPEIAASSYEMRGIMEPLSQHYRVYALDLPGFSLSDHPHIAYTGEMYVASLQDFLAHVVNRPATLVASGLSANYAIALASAAPELCERLVLLSPTALFTDGKLRHWYTPLLENPLIGLCVYAFLTTRIVLHAVLTRGQGTNALSESELDHYFAAAHQFGAEHPVVAYMAGNLSLDISRQLETLRQPMLVIWGLHAMQQALHSVRINALQEGATSPLLALTDTSSTVDSKSADATRRAVLLEDAGRHVQEAQATQVASFILAEPTNVPETKQHVTSSQVAEFVVDDYTNKEESLTGASSLQDAMVEARSDADVLQDIEREEEAQGEQGEQGEQGVQGVHEPEIAETQPIEQVEAYCVKCKQKRIMDNPTETTTKNGRRAKEGNCPVCGTHLFRFVAG